MKNYIFILLGIGFISFGCNNSPKVDPDFDSKLSNPDHLFASLENLTDVIVHDIFSPPVASRVYVYPCIAAYEIMCKGNSDYKSMSGQLNDFEGVSDPEKNKSISNALAAIRAFNVVGGSHVFSEDKMKTFTDKLYGQLDSIGVPKDVWNNSIMYGEKVAQEILNWADKDRYKQLRSMPKYTITDEEGRWKPTPPAYMEGIEPNWREVRTMVLKSSNQFPPKTPPEYSLDKTSEFYRLTQEVKDAVTNATKEHKLIASFWDCNPFVMNQTGHMMFATKKITPGGHWMGIATLASKKSNSNFMQSIENLTMVSISLFDAFISCWDEKYKSNLIRPETVINEHMDPTWIPVLQTPPFPEHTSGHSVISSASAVALTSLLGDNFAFTDDVETKYGLPERKFASFFNAADEAAISRLYGGIHYMPAIEDGVAQGKKVGNYIVQNLKTKQ